MKKLIVHIGTHKTGTSAFQQVLINNKESLRKNDKIGIIELNDFPKLNELKVSKSFNLTVAEELKDFLLREMITNEKFIISNERLSGSAYGEVYSNTKIIVDTLKFATRDIYI